MSTYETVFITVPTLTEDAERSTVDALATVVSDMGGTLHARDRMGRRRLAYPIKKQEDGVYTRLLYDSNGDVPKELERRMKLSDDVLRVLTVKLEREWAEEAKVQAVRDAEARIEAAKAEEARAKAEAEAAAAAAAAAEAAAAETAEAAGEAGEATTEEAPAEAVEAKADEQPAEDAVEAKVDEPAVEPAEAKTDEPAEDPDEAAKKDGENEQ